MMNELATRQQETGLAISDDTKALIMSGVAENTIVAYRRATQKLEAVARRSDSDRWLAGNLHHPVTS